MASFDSDGLLTVAHVEGRSLPHKVLKKSALWLLCPFLAWKVLMPKATNRKLDVFEEYVLRFSEAGIRAAREISDALEMDVDLIGYIVARLQSKQFLDEDGRPTEDGRRLLLEQTTEDQELESCYVFAEPGAHRLWPYVHRGMLPTIEVEPRGRQWILHHGSQGNPRRSWAWELVPSIEKQIITPTASGILEASRKHMARLKRLKHSRNSNADEFEPEPIDEGRIADRVFIASDTPEIIYWSAFIYIPDGVDGERGWQVCDPFGLGSSAELRRCVSKQLELDEDFKNHVKDKYSFLLSLDEPDAVAIAEGINSNAAATVRAATGEKILNHPDLYGLLIQLQVALNEQGDSDSVVRRAHECLEEMLAMITESWRNAGLDDYCDAALSRDSENNAELVFQMCGDLGFHRDECLLDFFKVTRGQLVSCLRHEGRKLSAQVALAIIMAHQDGLPVLRTASEQCPDLPVRLYTVNLWRDRAAHGGEEDAEQPPPPNVFAEHVYAALAALFPELVEDVSNLTGHVSSDLWQHCRRVALQDIEFGLGYAVRRHGDLFDRLLSMQAHRRVVSKLSANGDAQHLVSGHSKDVMYDAGRCLEIVFKKLNDRFRPPIEKIPLASGDRDAVRAYFNDCARVLGWLNGEVNELPAHIVEIDPRKIEIAAGSHTGSIHALFLLCLASAATNEQHPLARSTGDWLGCTARVSLARGHGDAVCTAADVSNVADDVLRVVRVLLKDLPT